MGNLAKTAMIAGLLIGMTGFSGASNAQGRDISPTLLIETGPSDNPAYRRMVFVKYLNGTHVTSNYKAYNRREFINLPDKSTTDNVRACANNRATKFSQIKAFERTEASLKRNNQPPEVRSFCIKNIKNWNAENKDKYLNPIFNGMPYVAGGN